MRLPTITDARGVPSQTLFFVALALTALLVRFVSGMFTELGQVSSTDFAQAFALTIGPWVVREGVEKLAPKSDV